ncbi:MAG: MBL fold metallo-hydrolase [Pseudomonadota bacterium]
MRLTVLGSGSPEPHINRASSGYLLEIGDDKILFDCGGGVFDNLIRAGFKPSDVTHLFFSHLHSDHFMDYARLVHAAWDEGAAPLKVFGPAPIARITDQYFGKNGVFSNDLRARTELKPSQDVWVARGGTLPRAWPAPSVTEVEPGFEMSENGWTVSSCAVPHAQPVLTCMAFAVEAVGKKFVYSGDAGLCAELKTLAAGADLLLHWCYRLDGTEASAEMAQMTPTPTEIGAMARQADVKRLFLTHFRTTMDQGDGQSFARRSAQEGFGQSVEIAADLQVIDI